MQIFFVLSSLWAISLAKPAVNEEKLPSNYGYAYAVDLDSATSYEAFSCMRSYGYRAVFIRGYNPSGMGSFDLNCVSNIRNARQGLKSANMQVNTIWVQVTSPINWDTNRQQNIIFLNEIITTANSYGVIIGFYTNAYDWNQILGTATVDNAMLWYWNVYGGGVSGETAPNFDDFRQFAKFTRPVAKQFGQVEYLCGVTVNRDVYAVNSLGQSSKSTAANSRTEIVIGSFGDKKLTGLVKSL
ncbi:hypothetical protein OESDEN_15827 [Oesophagostomum dentatum]|uniref:Glycosyl hydrolase family 25 n=1 Tax=Oesophagostomum dentatum TaxID=61180 RepID=A0A0B1SHQ5_OESDE|nr:hypothetical protein OESDEN_15827 [Oesophagostomum dentatum]